MGSIMGNKESKQQQVVKKSSKGRRQEKIRRHEPREPKRRNDVIDDTQEQTLSSQNTATSMVPMIDNDTHTAKNTEPTIVSSKTKKMAAAFSPRTLKSRMGSFLGSRRDAPEAAVASSSLENASLKGETIESPHGRCKSDAESVVSAASMVVEDWLLEEEDVQIDLVDNSGVDEQTVCINLYMCVYRYLSIYRYIDIDKYIYIDIYLPVHKTRQRMAQYRETSGVMGDNLCVRGWSYIYIYI